MKTWLRGARAAPARLAETANRRQAMAHGRVFAALTTALLAVTASGQTSRDDPHPAEADVFSYSIQGSIQLDSFGKLVAPFVGRRKTATDIEHARGAVEQAYRDFGYCSVKVVLAQQDEGEATVMFRLVEDPGGALVGCPDAQTAVKTGALRTEFHVKSLRTLRDEGVVKQHYDYSCGSAALATLLTYGLNDSVDEQALLSALLEPLAPDEIKALEKKGLSLSDLQRLAQMRGHKARGFRVHESQLAKLSRPVIVFIKPHGYEHFAVLKGVRGDRVYLADPSLGNIRMPLYRFLDMWADASGRGVILAVERASGDWPLHYASQIPDTGNAPLEVLTADWLIDSGKPLTSVLPGK